MTRKLFYEFPEDREFSARVERCTPSTGGVWSVKLDQTAFYPTSGGQPHDSGNLGGVRVLDVVEEGEDVLHMVEAPLEEGSRVEGVLDWERRWDHRRQHTGQHILSRALLGRGAATVGFHLGEDRCTIDLDRPLGAAELEAGEAEANAVVLQNLSIEDSWHADAASLPEDLRNEVPESGPIRLVSIQDFDVNPCCGTHCRSTGDVGPIKILRWEKWKDGLRVEFVCGNRAMLDFARRVRALRETALTLTTDEDSVPERVNAMQNENKALRSELEKARKELLEFRVRDWSRSPEPVVVADLEAGWDKHLARTASRILEEGGGAALVLAPAGDSLRVAFASGRSEVPAGTILGPVFRDLGGRGGGNEAMAQGAVPADRREALITAVRKAVENVNGTPDS